MVDEVDYAQLLQAVTLAVVLQWFAKIRRAGQDYLVEFWGFDMRGPNHKQVEEMRPKGRIYPFMDEVESEWLDGDVLPFSFTNLTIH
jgi:hypothetical protein